MLGPEPRLLRPLPMTHGGRIASQQDAKHGRGKGRRRFGHVDRAGEPAIDQHGQAAQVIGMGVGEKHRGHRFHAGGQRLDDARGVRFVPYRAAGGLAGGPLLQDVAAVDHPSAIAGVEHVQRARDFTRGAVAGGRQLRGRGRMERWGNRRAKHEAKPAEDSDFSPAGSGP